MRIDYHADRACRFSNVFRFLVMIDREEIALFRGRFSWRPFHFYSGHRRPARPCPKSARNGPAGWEAVLEPAECAVECGSGLNNVYNSNNRDRLKGNPTMKTYVASIGGNAVLAFRAEDDDNARAMIDDQEGGIRSDLKALVGAEGNPLWDEKSAIQAQEATAAQHAEWEQSRDQAISDDEIDLDAGDDPDDWSVYLTSIPQTK
jgi:hypothetical protein